MSAKRKAFESPASTPKRARKVLTLAQKVQVLDLVHGGMSHRAVADKFNVGRTQINNIVLQKQRIMKDYESGKNATGKYLSDFKLQYPEIDSEVWDFFMSACSKNIPVNGPMLLSEANESAFRHNYTNFQASNGWLQKFCTRHMIKMSALHGESADVSDDVVDIWKKKLPSVCNGYADRDIYNMDETAIFYRLLPNRSYIQKGETPSGTKIIKDRYTVVVCANLAGDKEKLWIIGKAKQPRSFPRKKAHLSQFNCHVEYRANKKGWQTTEFYLEFLRKFNNKMAVQRRNVLLFLDNCPSHPAVEMSKVKLVFLPKNTTSKTQPLDQGVIRSLKGQYQKRVRNEARTMIKEVSDFNEFAKRINIFEAIINTKLAWDMVAPKTVTKCFVKCGITQDIGLGIAPLESDNSDIIVESDDEDTDPLLDLPLSQYLKLSDEMEAKEPSRAPDTHAHQEGEEEDHDMGPVEIISEEQVWQHLKELSCITYTMDDEIALQLLEKLKTRLQTLYVKHEVITKTVQPSLTDFFKSNQNSNQKV